LAAVIGALSVPVALASDWPKFGKEGWSVTLPATWRDLSTRSSLRPTAADLSRRYPRLRPYLVELARLNGPLVPIVAADLTPGSLRHGFLTTVSLRPAAEPSQAHWFDAVLRDVRADPSVTGPVWHRRRHLRAGQAIELRYRWLLSAPGASYRLAVTQFGVRTRGASYMLNCWTTPAQDSAYRSVFERSAASSRAPS